MIHHYVHGLVEDGKLAIDWIESSAILADGLTKALPTVHFKKQQGEWGLIE